MGMYMSMSVSKSMCMVKDDHDDGMVICIPMVSHMHHADSCVCVHCGVVGVTNAPCCQLYTFVYTVLLAPSRK
jgi:hypothetical protein